MNWRACIGPRSGAEALLQLRCVAENGDWEAFHDYRKRDRLKTVYHGATSMPASLASEAIATGSLECRAA